MLVAPIPSSGAAGPSTSPLGRDHASRGTASDRPASARKIRVVVAKPGLDGHDRGAKIIARALRDAGMEVIYTGLHQTPEQIVETVLQEDADAVGLSILSGAHMTLVPRIVALLKVQDAGDVLVTVGGTIPADDIPQIKELGVAEVFTPGAPTRHRRVHPRTVPMEFGLHSWRCRCRVHGIGDRRVGGYRGSARDRLRARRGAACALAFGSGGGDGSRAGARPGRR